MRRRQERRFDFIRGLFLLFDGHGRRREREALEGLFPLAYELIQRALVVVKDVEDGTPYDVAQRSRDTFKSEAQTFLDAARLISRNAAEADARRRQLEG